MLGTNAQIFRYIANMFKYRENSWNVVQDLYNYANELDPRVMTDSECLGHVLTGHHNQANLGEFDA
jgi:hypothetical protein